MTFVSGYQLADADIRLLDLCAQGHTYRAKDVPGDDFQLIVDRLRRLRELGLIRLEEGRVMKSQTGQRLMAGPCDLTEAGRRALEEDRRLGPRP
jgi:hypothetical protein